MERELKEGDRIVDWDGNHGTARNVGDDGWFDFHQDDGKIIEGYGWIEEDDVGAFMFEAPDA